jgi:2-keto-4-pentenoate hydratase/2-oxohepta-3-ene-1,7-dioic acid hydratase in catechol pathway
VRLVRFEHDGRTSVGILREDGMLDDLGVDDLRLVMDSSLPGSRATLAAAEVRLLAPVPRPGKVLCAGVNYHSHKDENPAAVIPSRPFFFSKLPSAVIGPGDPIVVPAPASQVDYEVELAVVIGRSSKNLSPEAALSAVFGYTVLNDVSGRDIQFVDNQITLGKGLDTFCPLGPVVVTADEVPDPQVLVVASRVNGEVRQHESTANMVFSVAELLAAASRHITLEAGDVISTGTPAGVGCFMRPPRFLEPGDTVEVEVDAIGVLSNPVHAGW